MDFSSDTSWTIIVHKKCYGLVSHNKHVLIVDFFIVDCEVIILYIKANMVSVCLSICGDK
jgi:hypothetical protein